MNNEKIKVGDNGVVFNMPILSKGVKVPIVGASIKIDFIVGKREFTKDAIVTNGLEGICQTTLTREDLSTPGYYTFQATVTMQNGNEFSSDPITFEVESKIKKSP